MTSPFSSTMRSLAADRLRGWAWVLGVALGVLAAWIGWFAFGTVTVYETTRDAHVETLRAAHPVQAPIPGLIDSVSMTLGQEVREGEILVELDSTPVRLRLEKERAIVAALGPQIHALNDELGAERESERHANAEAEASVTIGQLAAQEAEPAAAVAEESASRFEEVYRSGGLAELEMLKTRSVAIERRAAANARLLDVKRLQSDALARASRSRVRTAQILREIALLRGQQEAGTRAVAELDQEIERHRIRAPVAGRLAEIGDLRRGSYLEEGARVAAIVPPGDLRVVAAFNAASAVGRIKPQQPARVEIDGFPWAQFGRIPATVERVASESRGGLVRIELSLRPPEDSAIPLEHGEPATVEVAIERVSPAALVLRAAGKAVSPRPSHRGSRGAAP